MEIRPTVAEDIPELQEVFTASIGSVYDPHGFAPPVPPAGAFAAQHRHLLETDPERCLVAVDDGRPVGYVAAWLRGHDWFLASLFIAPSAQGVGLGTRLLDAAWQVDGRVRRRTLTDAIQPISNALYARRGLIPATPLLSFSGRPSPSGSTLVAGSGELSAIDLAGYGFDRAVDHRFWGEIAERTVWLRDGAPAAYSYRFAGGAIGPVAGVDPAAAAAALDGELVRAEGSVSLRVPGSSRTLVDRALAAGLRLSPTPGLLLLSDGVAPPAELAISSYTLF